MARKRRGRGEGSVYQRSDGQWCGNVTIGYDTKGKRRRKVIYGKTKTEAQEKLRKAQHDIDTGILKAAESITVGEHLNNWLEGSVKVNRRISTYVRHRSVVDLYLIPTIGKVRLEKLNASMIDSLFIKLEREGRSCYVKGHVYSALHRAMKIAVDRRIIPFNPCNGVERPRIETKERPTYDVEQVGTLLDTSKGHRLHCLIVLAVTTGMRQGELFGLRWQDIDFENESVRVTRQLVEVRGQFSFGLPKTKAGKRNITLPKIAVEALREHRTRMMAEGNIGADTVFCDTQGGFLRKSNFRRKVWVPLVEKSGLPVLRFNDLRHTAATILLTLKENPKVVQERLGHSKIHVTMDTYSHVIESIQKEAANKLDSVFETAKIG